MRIVVFLLILFLPATGSAFDQIKPYTVSLVSYATVISTNLAGTKDDELSGWAVSGTGVFHDTGVVQAAARATLAFQTHDDVSSIDATTLELSLIAGQKLNREGFKWYLGGGLFNEKWELAGFSETFSGLQLTAGLGYNWAPVALDFWISMRDASDYEDFVRDVLDVSVDARAASAGLALGLRF